MSTFSCAACFQYLYCHNKIIWLISISIMFDQKHLFSGKMWLCNLTRRRFLFRFPQVADLGLSKVKQQTFVSGGVRGTLPWMAPELLNGSSSFVTDKVDPICLFSKTSFTAWTLFLYVCCRLMCFLLVLWCGSSLLVRNHMPTCIMVR